MDLAENIIRMLEHVHLPGEANDHNAFPEEAEPCAELGLNAHLDSPRGEAIDSPSTESKMIVLFIPLTLCQRGSSRWD